MGKEEGRRSRDSGGRSKKKNNCQLSTVNSQLSTCLLAFEFSVSLLRYF
ncbi:MAG: hypothetical protein HC942_19895 [Microcoleus sp. SU_5_6]|nr:hypothetical protein [Microcoleus sp. SU_5_6]